MQRTRIHPSIENYGENRLPCSFFKRDVLLVAPDLPGRIIARNFGNELKRYMITEVEAYRGEEDAACHARFGKTSRNYVMYKEGGILYLYLIYGIHWMLNIVTGEAGFPQAVLIRSLKGLEGPGRLTKELRLNENNNCENICLSKQIWFESGDPLTKPLQKPRIGIDYALEPWKSIPWRFSIND